MKPIIILRFVGMFVTIRGIDQLGLDYKLPTTEGFYNIFHPYDPVAYRIEALVNPDLGPLRPVLIPHHKGRKRMHLELRETMQRVGNDIKQKIVDTFKTTMNTVYSFSLIKNPDPKTIQQEVDKVLQDQLAFETNASRAAGGRPRLNSASTTSSDVDNGDTDLPLGRLNEGRRIDYVLQEAPLEFFNEYLFALTSHVGYWYAHHFILLLIWDLLKHFYIDFQGICGHYTFYYQRDLHIAGDSDGSPNSTTNDDYWASILNNVIEQSTSTKSDELKSNRSGSNVAQRPDNIIGKSLLFTLVILRFN